MENFDRDSLRKMLAAIGFAPSSRQLLDYWLSLCSGNTLPDRSAIRPADIKKLLPGLVIFDVVPGKSVVVRLAGTAFTMALGTELKGADWIGSAPESHRPQRLRLFSDVALGAIGRVMRRVEILPAGGSTFEEVFVPCRADSVTGLYPVIGHTDWNSGGEVVKVRSAEQALGAPLTSEIIALPTLNTA